MLRTGFNQADIIWFWSHTFFHLPFPFPHFRMAQIHLHEVHLNITIFYAIFSLNLNNFILCSFFYNKQRYVNCRMILFPPSIQPFIYIKNFIKELNYISFEASCVENNKTAAKYWIIFDYNNSHEFLWWLIYTPFSYPCSLNWSWTRHLISHTTATTTAVVTVGVVVVFIHFPIFIKKIENVTTTQSAPFLLFHSHHYLTLRRKGGIPLRFLSVHLENPEHHLLVMGCDTLTPMDISLSKVKRKTNILIARPSTEKS